MRTSVVLRTLRRFSRPALTRFACSANIASGQEERSCKRLVHPAWSLADWTKDQLYCQTWPAAPTSNVLECPRFHISDTSRLDITKPAIIEGVLDSWPSPMSWELDRMLHAHADTEFIVGATSPTGADATPTDCSVLTAVFMTLNAYWEYAVVQTDDCPLYIFDENALDDDQILKGTYCRPRCFAADLMDVLGNERPPHRWLLIGATRSGTLLHIDPLATAAWNTLVNGRKRWVLFPPSTTASQLQLASLDEDIADSPTHWLHSRYPNVAQSDAVLLDFIQRPGETVYVPNGWWHNVVNLDFSIAVTENFVGKHNFAASYRAVKEMNPDVATAWFDALSEDSSMHELLGDVST